MTTMSDQPTQHWTNVLNKQRLALERIASLEGCPEDDRGGWAASIAEEALGRPTGAAERRQIEEWWQRNARTDFALRNNAAHVTSQCPIEDLYRAFAGRLKAELSGEWPK